MHCRRAARAVLFLAVLIPFPPLARAADRPTAAAIESARQETATPDPRLDRPVDCAFKATALADLCARLQAETGVPLAAGPSVADEKVTVFCGKLPLREVMRQLSRPFGYTWLRSEAFGVRRQALVDSPVGSNAQRLAAPGTEHRSTRGVQTPAGARRSCHLAFWLR